MEQLVYRILLRKEPEGGYTGLVLSLPGRVTFEENSEDAIEMAEEAIELYQGKLKARGNAIPCKLFIYQFE